MLELFVGGIALSDRNISMIAIENIQRRSQTEINRVVKYYETSGHYVDPSNLLYQIIFLMGMGAEGNLNEIAHYYTRRAKKRSASLGLVSDIRMSALHQGQFFGNDVLETVWLDDTYYNVLKTHSDWKNVTAVRTLTHPYTTLRAPLPMGLGDDDMTGKATISINVSMLMIQFRAYVEEYNDRGESTSIRNFIVRYVLPKMLYVNFNIALFNRIYNLKFLRKNEDDFHNPHPIEYANYSKKWQRLLVRIHEATLTQSSFANIIAAFPTVDNTKPHDYLKLPSSNRTVTIMWTIVATRYRVLRYLLDVATSHRVSDNNLIGRLNAELFRLKNTSIYNRNGLLGQHAATFKADFDILLEYTK